MKKIVTVFSFILGAVLISPALWAQELKKTETFYNDGKIKEYYQVDAEGLKQGAYTLNYPNGNKHLQIEFKNGLKEGKFISWHENGKVKEEATYRNNKKHGKYIYYDELGNITEKGK